MQINNISGSSVSAAVWAAAVRSLTVDPATDAGAATFVWTHAARSLTVDPATDAGAATLVWTHATRNLTSLINAIGGTSVGKTSIAASASVNIQPPSNTIQDITVAVDNALVVVGMSDGTNTMFGATPASIPGPLTFTGCTNSVFPVIKNTDGGAAHNYMYTVKRIFIN